MATNYTSIVTSINGDGSTRSSNSFTIYGEVYKLHLYDNYYRIIVGQS